MPGAVIRYSKHKRKAASKSNDDPGRGRDRRRPRRQRQARLGLRRRRQGSQGAPGRRHEAERRGRDDRRRGAQAGSAGRRRRCASTTASRTSRHVKPKSEAQAQARSSRRRHAGCPRPPRRLAPRRALVDAELVRAAADAVAPGRPAERRQPVQMGLQDLSGATLPAPAVYDLDGETTSKATVDALHAMGKKVICYVDAGTYEQSRSDASKFQAISPPIYGSAVSGWPGEFWLDIHRVADLAPIMQARFQDVQGEGLRRHRARQHRRLEQQHRLLADRRRSDRLQPRARRLGPRHRAEHRAQERSRSGVPARRQLRLGAQRAVLRVQRVLARCKTLRAGRQGRLDRGVQGLRLVSGPRSARTRRPTTSTRRATRCRSNAGRQPCTAAW